MSGACARAGRFTGTADAPRGAGCGETVDESTGKPPPFSYCITRASSSGGSAARQAHEALVHRRRCRRDGTGIERGAMWKMIPLAAAASNTRSMTPQWTCRGIERRVGAVDEGDNAEASRGAEPALCARGQGSTPRGRGAEQHPEVQRRVPGKRRLPYSYGGKIGRNIDEDPT